MKITRIDLNSWLLEMGGKRILVDPWLVDPLVFYGFPWLFEAYHLQAPCYTPETLPPVDLILISQGLDDHCHKPTLEQLDRAIPVVASPAAAKTVQQLGYQQVITLKPWQDWFLGENLQILAVPGAPVQGTVENGFVVKDLIQNQTLYYEPHLFRLEAKIGEQVGTVDVAIAPVIGQVFPLLGKVIMGPQEALTLVQTLKPQIFIPNALGEIRASGILPQLIRSVGSLEEFQHLLSQTGSSTRLVVPDPGETLDLAGEPLLPGWGVSAPLEKLRDI